MTIIYHAVLELHDSLYFATREIGRLYETEPVLHNYALSYVLGLVDNPQFNTVVDDEEYSYRYFCAEQVPRYEEHLTPLNEQGIYVTPAIALHHSSTLSTWKYADNHYHVEMQQMETNTPSFGRTKEISPESQFEFFVFAQIPLIINRWLRIGKWASKAKLEIKPLTNLRLHQASEFTYEAPLNPLDVMFANQVLSYDTLNMPPVSLICNVRMIGDYYTSEDYPGLKLPARMQYSFGG